MKSSSSRVPIFAALALAAAASPLLAEPAPAAELPRGVVIEKVEVSAQPRYSYALYLPTGYRPDRAWPILYAFDARKHGKLVAERFQAAAETYGWIVAGSNDSMSDVAMAPGLEIMRAMWVDTHARLAIDDLRAYAAGFSGTVRLACTLGLTAPGTIAGVIGASAGFPTDRPPTKDVPFVFFGTVGDRDFNYYEMAELEETMTRLGLPHRIEPFEGGHTWPPEELAARAVGWMELQAMKAGKRARSAEIVEALWAEDLRRARSQEAAGRVLAAHHTWSAMAADYAGLRDVAAAERKAAELSASEAFKTGAQERSARHRRDVEYLEQAPQILARSNPVNAVEGPVTVKKVAAELKIPELKARAGSADPQESLSAQRLLNLTLVQTAYYLPRMFTGKGEHDRALFMLSIAAEIRPDDPEIWYEMAAAHARKGRSGRKKALEALRKAAEHGWTDAALIEREPAFDGMRQDEAFRQIVGRIKEAHG